MKVREAWARLACLPEDAELVDQDGRPVEAFEQGYWCEETGEWLAVAPVNVRGRVVPGWCRAARATGR